MTFIDTNYFLRFLLKDIDEQHQEAKAIFNRAALGEVTAFTSIIVFFEIYWVLSSFYEKEEDELVETLQKILSMEFIELESRELLREALEVFTETNVELEDAFNLTYAKASGANDFKTFNQKLGKLFNSTTEA